MEVQPRARGKRPARGDPVVDRAFALLAAFDARHRVLSLGELSRRSGIPASSALRLAGRLLAWGALERGEDGRFSVGVRLWEVASLAPRGQGLKQVALPFMGDLEEVTRQHVLLAVRDGVDALLVERLSGHQAMPVLYRVGGRLPLHSTGVGLVLLAFADPAFQESVLERPLVHEPERVAVSPAALRRTAGRRAPGRDGDDPAADARAAGERGRPDLRRGRPGGRGALGAGAARWRRAAPARAGRPDGGPGDLPGAGGAAARAVRPAAGGTAAR
jgi:DNA-binding IclR family transcriptional regulator